jgi:hypothetical protein
MLGANSSVLRAMAAALACGMLASGAAPASAQELVCVNPQYIDVIDQTQTNNWRYQMRRRDFGLMAQLAGVWQSQEPNGVGGVSNVQTTSHAEGSLLYEKRTCVSMPGLGTSCPTSIGHGYWAAHPAGDGTIMVASILWFSHYTGDRTKGVCGGGPIRMIDANTQMGPTGQIARRVR